MRRRGYPAGMRLAIVVALFSMVLPVAAAAPARRAHVTLGGVAPVSVDGSAFRARERVTLTVIARTVRTKDVTASAAGRFRTTFRRFSIGRCDAYMIRATGNRGSVAVLRVTPECAPLAPPVTTTTDGLLSDPVGKKGH